MNRCNLPVKAVNGVWLDMKKFAENLTVCEEWCKDWVDENDDRGFIK